MASFKRGKVYWYEFTFKGERNSAARGVGSLANQLLTELTGINHDEE